MNTSQPQAPRRRRLGARMYVVGLLVILFVPNWVVGWICDENNMPTHDRMSITALVAVSVFTSYLIGYEQRRTGQPS